MSYQSQIFEVMITSEEYDTLVQDNKQLKEQQNRYIQELEELKKKIEKLESCGAQNDSLKDIIKRLSKEVLKHARKNTEIEEELTKQNQLQADISREELTHLREQLDQNMQQVKALTEINQQLKAQIEASTPLIAQGNGLKLQVHYLKEEIQKRDYLIINERNIMEKREQTLKEKESAFQSTKQQVELLKTELEKEKQEMKADWDQKETDMVQQFIKRENDLEEEYQKRKNELEAEYERRIASIKDFATCLELEENNTNLTRQLENVRQKLSEFQQNTTAFQVKEEEYKKMISKLKKNNKQLQIEIEGLKQRIIQVKKGKGTQNIDHEIIEYFSTFILLFQSKLQQAGETSIREQLDNKKSAMFKALEKEYHKIIASHEKPIRKSSY